MRERERERGGSVTRCTGGGDRGLHTKDIRLHVSYTGLTKFTNSSEKRTALGSRMDNNGQNIFTLSRNLHTQAL